MLDDNNIFSYTNTYIFNPSVTVFDKSIFIQHKKLGTRYISSIASYPAIPPKTLLGSERIKSFEFQDCYQLELFFQTHPLTDVELSMNLENYYIKGSLFDFYVYTSFEVLFNDNENHKFKKFTSSKEFLEYNNVKNFNEFFFENPKDLYFVIRNPIERFLSGVVQILLTATIDLVLNEKTRNEIKFYTNTSDRELKDAIKVFGNANSNVISLEQIPTNILFPILEYFIEKKWDLIFNDVHTQNYLNHFVTLLNGVKDKTKIKIVDISQFSSNKSKELIKNLRTEFEDPSAFQLIETFKASNKKIYEQFITKYSNKNLTFYNYVKSEMQIYNSLINSKFFIDLKD